MVPQFLGNPHIDSLIITVEGVQRWNPRAVLEGSGKLVSRLYAGYSLNSFKGVI